MDTRVALQVSQPIVITYQNNAHRRDRRAGDPNIDPKTPRMISRPT